MTQDPANKSVISAETPREEQQKKKDRGATFVEYILLVTLIALAAVAVLRIFGQTVSSKFSEINSTVKNAT